MKYDKYNKEIKSNRKNKDRIKLLLERKLKDKEIKNFRRKSKKNKLKTIEVFGKKD